MQALVGHAGWLEHDAPLEEAHRLFTERQVKFLALVRDGMVTGLCSRLKLGVLLGGRFGFALHSRRPAHLAQIDRPLVFAVSTPVRDVLDHALARPSEAFHEDVALVDENHALVGLVPIDALARLQTQLVSEQLAELKHQHEELLAADRAWRQSQGRYTGLFENPILGIALLDVRGAVHTQNRRLTEMLNIDAATDGLVSLPAWLPEPDRTGFLAALGAQAQGARPTTRELALDVPGRGARTFRCSIGWISETRQICACLDDVTEQRTLERRLLRQEKQMLLDTLVGGIAHELNNKLTPVQGFSDLIALNADDQTRHYAGVIAKSVGEAATIIRQLLQLSKPSMKVAQTVDLRGVVAEALSMLRFQIRELRCTVKTTQPADAVWVHVDPAEIKQVVINLALNALQAMSERAHGTLEVEVRSEDARALIAVTDNGVGIPPENLERIFDPFFTTKGPERGTGLGLSVCLGIVRQHGGEIAVESQPGVGARFTVSLPREAMVPQAATRAVATTVPALPPAPAGASPGARVLVVEDELHVRRLISEVLASKFGCEVDTVANGVDALERLATTRYALVLSDVRMPTMNGTELYLWLREAQPLTATRFVFITGYPGESHLEAEIAEWSIPVLTKPFTVQALCDLCAPFLRQKSEPLLASA